MTSALLFRCYIWLAETIASAGRISIDDIRRRWQGNAGLNPEGEPLPERTFHNWRHAVEDLFCLNIECDRSTKQYYIENSDDLEHGELRSWIINSFAVSNLLHESEQLHDRILFEKIPSGQQFLTTVLEAMRSGRRLEVRHQKFGSDEPTSFRLSPYCVKCFEQRWYVTGRPDHRDGIRTYALDRILEMRLLDEAFRMPADFVPEAYFAHTVGITGTDRLPEHLVLRVSAWQAPYLRTLPLHPSQRETQTAADFCTFEYDVSLSYELKQRLRAMGTHAEVLAPAHLRAQFAQEFRELSERYGS